MSGLSPVSTNTPVPVTAAQTALTPLAAQASQSFFSTILLSLALLIKKATDAIFYFCSCYKATPKPHTITLTPPANTPQIPTTIQIPTGPGVIRPEPQPPAPVPTPPPVVITPPQDPRALELQARLRWDQGMAAPRNGNINLAGSGPALQPAPPAFPHWPPLPYITRYVGGNSDLSFNQLLVRLPKNQLNAFPEGIRTRFANVPEDQLDLFFIVQSDSYFTNPGTSPHRNINFHTATFPNIQHGGRGMIDVQMGLFNPFEVTQSQERSRGIYANGTDTSVAIPFNTFGPQLVYVHDQALSPNNARFFITEAPISSFFTAAELPNGRRMAAFHILVNDEDSPQGRIVTQALSQPNLRATLTTLQSGHFTPAIMPTIEQLLTFQAGRT